MSTHAAVHVLAGRHSRPPSLLTLLLWALACLDAWLLGATGGRHEMPRSTLPEPLRPEFGVDDTYVSDLHGWNNPQDADTENFALVGFAAWDRAMLMPDATTAPIPVRPTDEDLAFLAGER